MLGSLRSTLRGLKRALPVQRHAIRSHCARLRPKLGDTEQCLDSEGACSGAAWQEVGQGASSPGWRSEALAAVRSVESLEMRAAIRASVAARASSSPIALSYSLSRLPWAGGGGDIGRDVASAGLATQTSTADDLPFPRHFATSGPWAQAELRDCRFAEIEARCSESLVEFSAVSSVFSGGLSSAPPLWTFRRPLVYRAPSE